MNLNIKTILLIIGINTTIISSVFSQALTGTKTVGAAGTYTTIKAAINALNTNGVGAGGVIFSLIDNAYSYTNTANTKAGCMWIGQATTSIVGIVGSSAVNTVTFKPALTKTPVITITASANSQAGFTLNAADYIIFDGSNTVGGTTRDMTIQMAGNYTTRVFYIKDTGVGGGSTNNVIKNSIIIGFSNVSSNYGIYMRNSAGAGNDENNNNTFENNQIYQTFYGIWFSGLAAGVDCTGNIARNNKIGSSGASSTYVACKGVYSQYQTNLEVSGNEIYNVLSGATIIIAGIEIERSTTVAISKNKIHEIGYTGTLGAGGKGIYLNTGVANPAITVTNNFISGIVGDGDAGAIALTPTGIYLTFFTTAPTSGISICFNSIYVTPNTSYGLNFNANIKVLGICVLNGVGGITMCSNIFRTSLGEKTGCTFVSNGYAAYCEAATSPFVTSDYNIYYTTGQDNNFVGFGNSATCTLAQWKTFTGQDVNSLNQDPKFISTSDLHIQPTFFVTGTACSAISTDIDGDSRSPLTRIGADVETVVVLPIGLTHFEATCIDNFSTINWTTASEINNDYFTIERTTDGINFDMIGIVEGAGNSNQEQAYSFFDNQVSSGILYYRLRQTDFDGNNETSDLISVSCEDKNSLSLQLKPNPACNELIIEISGNNDEMKSIFITDVTGQSVITMGIPANRETIINIEHLSKGVYFVSSPSIEIKSIKFIKQ